MEIKEITVSASLSRNYQKAEFSVVAEIESEDEREYVKRYCVEQASQLLDQIEAEVKKTPVSTPAPQPVQTPVYQSNPTYGNNNYSNNGPVQMRPRSNNYSAPYNNGAAPTQKQINYLRNLGYTGQIPATKQDADNLLQQLKSNRR